MTAEARLEALARASAGDLERLADRILAGGAAVVVLAGPEVASAPLRLPVPGTASTFVVGRTVLTTCAVALDGTRGDGVVQGRALRAALAAAVCDAEAERGGPLAADVAHLARGARTARGSALAEEGRRVALTRLDEAGSGPVAGRAPGRGEA